MFRINTLTVKNFMSVGNQTQAVDFNRDDLTLVLGKNLDMGGDSEGARNGTGKTTIINALSYALYGQALTRIKVNNLVNKTNGKHMLVTVEFEKDGINYRIERGRKPNVMRFYIEDQEKLADDESQGDSRRTQEDIEKMLSMTHDMFKHVLALNTYSEPFLRMRANDQRSIIEQLLGITLLSEKADELKVKLKETKDGIREEEVRIETQKQSNDKISDTIENLKRRQRVWHKNHTEKITDLEDQLDALSHIDIEKELEAHAAHQKWSDRVQELVRISDEQERAEKSHKREEKAFDKAETDLAALKEMKCPTCHQDLHDEKHDQLISKAEDHFAKCVEELSKSQQVIDILAAQLDEFEDPGDEPDRTYDNIQDAHNHNTTLGYLNEQLKVAGEETDPYQDQIEELENEALVEIKFDKLNSMANLRDHQEFLLKLLTNKDSYIRKKIIDQSLALLNSRLGHYLEKIQLPHTVEFQNDLTVDITEFGREFDFDNLSRGEQNRLILSMSWAFRDVWENLYQPINLLFVDELIDSGMDISGIDNSLSVLKSMSRERKKSVWLVSHKDDLASRVHNVLTVTKENGYTTYGTDIDIR